MRLHLSTSLRRALIPGFAVLHSVAIAAIFAPATAQAAEWAYNEETNTYQYHGQGYSSPNVGIGETVTIDTNVKYGPNISIKGGQGYKTTGGSTTISGSGVVKSTEGNITIKGGNSVVRGTAGSNTIDGTVDAAGNISITGGLKSNNVKSGSNTIGATGEVIADGNLKLDALNNTIDGTVSAGKELTTVGNTTIKGAATAVNEIYMSMGENKISEGGSATTTGTAANIKMDALDYHYAHDGASNTIEGKASATATGDIIMEGGDVECNNKYDTGKTAGSNTISGTATAGRDITMTGGTVTDDALNDATASMGGSNTITGTATAGRDITMTAGTTTTWGKVGSNTIGDGTAETTVNASGSVTLQADTNIINKASVTAGENIVISGGESTLTDATLLAKGSVNVTDASVRITGNSSLTAKGGMALDDATLIFGVEDFDKISTDISSYINMATTGTPTFDGAMHIVFELDNESLASAMGISQDFRYTLFSNVDGEGVDKALSAALSQGSVTFAYAGEYAQATGYTVSYDDNSNVVISGVVTIPEPTTVTLSLLALCGLAARRRR